jgi:hypothetical protein
VKIEVGNYEKKNFLQQEIDVTFSAVCLFLCGMVWRHTAVSLCIVCDNTMLTLLIHNDVWSGFV